MVVVCVAGFCSVLFVRRGRLHSGIIRPLLPTAGIADTCRRSGCVLCAPICKGFALGVLVWFLRPVCLSIQRKGVGGGRSSVHDVTPACGFSFSIFCSPELATFSVSGAMQENWHVLCPMLQEIRQRTSKYFSLDLFHHLSWEIQHLLVPESPENHETV